MLPLLPVGSRAAVVVTLASDQPSGENPLAAHWKNEYAEADKELLRLEDELDALILLVRSTLIGSLSAADVSLPWKSSLLREQRMEAMQGVVGYPEHAPAVRIAAACAAEKLNAYLGIQEKSKHIDEAVWTHSSGYLTNSYVEFR